MDILLAIVYVHDISHPQIHYHPVHGWQIAIQIYSPEKATFILGKTLKLCDSQKDKTTRINTRTGVSIEQWFA